MSIAGLVLLFVLIGGWLGARESLSRSGLSDESREVAIPIRNEIERGIDVKGLENKFVYVRMSLFAGAGAGGLGAPQIFAYSAEQFIELIPKSEPVYVSLAYGKTSYGDEDTTVLKKVYWSFIENRAGLMVYEDVYQYSGGWIKNFNSQRVVFQYDSYESINWWYACLLGVVIVVMIIIILFGLAGISNTLKDSPFFN